MCLTCGCGRLSPTRNVDVGALSFAPTKEPAVRPEPPSSTTIALEHALTAKNDGLATSLRQRFARQRILALNLLSSPGAGKTTLLERTLADVGADLDIAVVEGDQETSRDAERLRKSGRKVVQVNTGAGCHLDAAMIGRALDVLDPKDDSTVVVENVGNLVCPALFDLGEHKKVVIFSVTEGEDKPLKYPHMFKAASTLVLSKIDLLPHLRFDVDQCLQFAREVNPNIEVLLLSATTGQGLPEWYAWLKQQKQEAR